MTGIGATTPIARLRTLHAGKSAVPESTFSVPASALRREGVRVGGRDRPAALAQPVDTVELSSGIPPFPGYAPLPETGAPPAFKGLGADKGNERNGDPAAASLDIDATGDDGENADESAGVDEPTDQAGKPLGDQERREVEQLKDRDSEVRRHEQAHKAAGGQYAGAISYDYQQGPDGKRYAVGGEVSIDVSPEKDPSATISKMQRVRAAALAPASPSPQDHAVAAEASRNEMEARQELNQERSEGAGAGDGAAEEGEEKDAGAEAEAPGGKASPFASAESAFARPATAERGGIEAVAALSRPEEVEPGARAGVGPSFARLSLPASAAIGRIDVYA